jgi:hypothetical protein
MDLPAPSCYAEASRSPKKAIGLSKEATMEAITLLIGITLRLALPLGLLFWLSSRLQAWDQKRGVAC